MREIPVLLYHNVGDYSVEMMEDGISPQAFARQMQYLSSNWYQIVNLDGSVDHLAGIGCIQIDDDDHNIFLTKISKLYLFFKDKRSWQYIRQYKIDRLAHRISETLDRIKRDK